MKLVAIGDSIARGTFLENEEWRVACPNFAEQLKEKWGASELVNYGVNGVAYSRTSPTNSEYAISKRTAEIEGGDIILIAAGTNDFGNNVEIGWITDNKDISFYGALHCTYACIKKRFPNAKVFVITPIPRVDENVPNEKGYVLNDYRKAIESKAQEFGFSVVNGEAIPIDPQNAVERERLLPDGLHPNQAGHSLYAEYLYQKIGEMQ